MLHASKCLASLEGVPNKKHNRSLLKKNLENWHSRTLSPNSPNSLCFVTIFASCRAKIPPKQYQALPFIGIGGLKSAAKIFELRASGFGLQSSRFGLRASGSTLRAPCFMLHASKRLASRKCLPNKKTESVSFKKKLENWHSRTLSQTPKTSSVLSLFLPKCQAKIPPKHYQALPFIGIGGLKSAAKKSPSYELQASGFKTFSKP